MSWHEHMTALLDRVAIRAWRLLLTTPQVTATVPMLRGVWGRALRHVDAAAYRQVFAPAGAAHRRLPRYILRPALPDPTTAPAVEWILLGVAESLEPVLWRAWDIASGMGLGPTRAPFAIRERVPLGPGNEGTRSEAKRWRLSEAERPAIVTMLPTSARSEAKRWRLSEAAWPLAGDPASTPCRLHFLAPVRLIRRGTLIEAPGLADIATAAARRAAGLAGEDRGEPYRNLIRGVQHEAAGLTAGPWRGERSDLVRWSAAQQREIDLYGVTGGLELPVGPGRLWPLLAAAGWTHIGKGTVFGLGQLCLTADS